MGFWDMVGEDFASFSNAMDQLLPPFVPLGPALVPKADVIAAGWVNPFSAKGFVNLVAWLAKESAGHPGANQDALMYGFNNWTLQAPKQQVTIGETIMGQLIIANVYRCVITMTAGGHTIENVVHVQGTSSGQQAAASAAVLAAWKVASGPLSRLSSLITMVSVSAMDLSSSNGGISIVTDTTAGGQTSSNGLATRASCAVIKLNGSTRSKSTRGRLYFGPLRVADIGTDGATVVGSSVSGFSTAFTNFMSSLSGAAFTWGVASRKLSSFTAATTAVSEAAVATQRRRQRLN